MLVWSKDTRENTLLLSLGKVVNHSQITIGKTLAYYWKLKAIESIEMSSGNKGLPTEEL
jgi:hypothetical protein